MKEAHLEINFCQLTTSPLSSCFEQLIINNIAIPTENKKVELIIPFNEFEKEIGKKTISYELIKKSCEKKISQIGIIEISLGHNISYCFIDISGASFELLYMDEKGTVEKFMKNKFELYVENDLNQCQNISISLNSNNSYKTANLILINCYERSIIKINNNPRIYLEELIDLIDGYRKCDSYQVCFSLNNFKNPAYRKIEPIKELNFSNIYDENNEKVEKHYNAFIDCIKNNFDLNEKYEELEKFEPTLSNIIVKKYIYSKNILEKELNDKKYIDFIFRIVFLLYIVKIKERDEVLVTSYVNDIHKNLCKNQELIYNDKLLKNYEKILLLIQIYLTNLLFQEEDIIKYFHVKSAENGSPLDLAIEFLYKFVEDLTYDSKFFYPLFCIDSGLFQIKYKKSSKNNLYITAYGFNMNSLDTLKHHLINIIPNIIIISNHFDDEDAETNYLTGFTTINLKKYEKIFINKKNPSKYINEHNAFVLARIFLHEIYGHKKSALSEQQPFYSSALCFKDKTGQLKYVSNKFDYNQYGDLENVIINIKNLDELEGDSGYFLEYFFGKVYDEYITELIDKIQNKTSLGVLLNSKLWHTDNNILIEYVKLKYYFINKYTSEELKVDEDLNIDGQIKEIKIIIGKKDDKYEDNIKEFMTKKSEENNNKFTGLTIDYKKYKNFNKNGEKEQHFNIVNNMFDEINESNIYFLLKHNYEKVRSKIFKK